MESEGETALREIWHKGREERENVQSTEANAFVHHLHWAVTFASVRYVAKH